MTDLALKTKYSREDFSKEKVNLLNFIIEY